VDSECEHKFEFLRQDKINVGYERNPTWLYADVFFCSRCLSYKNIPVKATQPSQESFYREDSVDLNYALMLAGGSFVNGSNSY